MTLLLCPPTTSRATGGYRYNARMARELRGRLRVCTADRERLGAVVRRIALRAPGTLVLLDSLYLAHLSGAELPEGVRCALLTHLLPSLAERDSDAAAALRDRERSLISRFHGFVAPSEFVANALRERGAAAESIAVCRPGVDRAFGRPARRILPPRAERTWAPRGGSRATGSPGAVGPLELLTVGTITGVKGYLELLETLEELRDLAWRWTIAGDRTRDANYAERFFARVASSAVARRTRYVGVASSRRVARLMERSDLFVLRSRFESYGMVIAEAAAQRLPFVVSDVGGVRETVGRGDRGLFCPPESDAAWRAALRRLLTERDALRGAAIDGSEGSAPAGSLPVRRWGDAARELARALDRFSSGASGA